jgi:adenylate cyclase
VREVIDWLLLQPPAERTAETFIGQLAERLREAGLPVWRLSTAMLSFDPYTAGAQYRWAEEEGVTVYQRLMRVDTEYVASPVKWVVDRGEDLRRRLDVPVESLEFPVLRELAASGATDYLILALPITEALSSARFHLTNSLSWISFTTRAPGGFTEAQVETLRQLRPGLAMKVALETSKGSARQLLQAYLGPNAARRVLEGSFKRGTSAPIEAVIWYCDMRGFTSLSDTTPAPTVVEALDRYFEAVAQPVEDGGGEVLKFIGDAVLAIFPVGPEGAGTPARAALAAVAQARANLRELNERQQAAGLPTLGFGIALHVGRVMYGNIGTRRRLDFTVIGAPVNEVCRVEALTRELGVDVLFTREFLQVAGLPEAAVRTLGCQVLKGVSGPREVFSLVS